MAQLKKTQGTLDELLVQEEEVKNEIRSLQRQQKQIRITRKAIQRLTASLPVEKKRRKSSSALATT